MRIRNGWRERLVDSHVLWWRTWASGDCSAYWNLLSTSHPTSLHWMLPDSYKGGCLPMLMLIKKTQVHKSISFIAGVWSQNTTTKTSLAYEITELTRSFNRRTGVLYWEACEGKHGYRQFRWVSENARKMTDRWRQLSCCSPWQRH